MSASMCSANSPRRRGPSHLVVAVAVLATAALGACAPRFRSRPLLDDRIVDSLKEKYESVEIGDLYQRVTDEAQRNAILNELLTLSDHNYEAFRSEFYASNAAIQSAFDVVSLGLSTAGALASDGAAPILSGVSAAVQGTQGKINTRYYLEKTTEALVNAMDTIRATKKRIILESMANKSLAEYSMEAGIRDVLEYHHGGSLISGLVKIAAETGAEKAAAERKLNETEAKLAGIRSAAFAATPEGEALDAFWRPGGEIDVARQGQLLKAMRKHGIGDVPISMLLWAPEFAEMRTKIVRELDLSAE